MKKSLIIAFLIILPGLLMAQNKKNYAPIDSVGWQLPDLSTLEGFDRSDLGSITYLLVLDKVGEIKKIKTLASTLKEETELKLRNQLEGAVLAKKENWDGKLSYRGVLQISLGACIDARDDKN